MPITLHIDRSRNLTIFKITGSITFNELMETFDQYREAGPTRYEIYDAIESTGIDVTSAQIDQIVKRGKQAKRPLDGKTALVVSADIDFGMSKVYQAVAEIEGMVWQTEVFRKMKDAYEWLDIPGETTEKLKLDQTPPLTSATF